MAEGPFFEDETSVEEERKPKVKKAGKPAPKKAPRKKPKKKSRYQKEGTSLGVIWVAGLVLFSFFLGFSLGMWVIPALTGGTTQTQQEQQQQIAPPLTQEQMQQGMPESHPPPGGQQTPSGTSTGTAP